MLPPTHQENDKKKLKPNVKKITSKSESRKEISPAQYVPEGSRRPGHLVEGPSREDQHKHARALCIEQLQGRLRKQKNLDQLSL